MASIPLRDGELEREDYPCASIQETEAGSSPQGSPTHGVTVHMVPLCSGQIQPHAEECGLVSRVRLAPSPMVTSSAREPWAVNNLHNGMWQPPIRSKCLGGR